MPANDQAQQWVMQCHGENECGDTMPLIPPLELLPHLPPGHLLLTSKLQSQGSKRAPNDHHEPLLGRRGTKAAAHAAHTHTWFPSLIYYGDYGDICANACARSMPRYRDANYKVPAHMTTPPATEANDFCQLVPEREHHEQPREQERPTRRHQAVSKTFPFILVTCMCVHGE